MWAYYSLSLHLCYIVWSPDWSEGAPSHHCQSSSQEAATECPLPQEPPHAAPLPRAATLSHFLPPSPSPHPPVSGGQPEQSQPQWASFWGAAVSQCIHKAACGQRGKRGSSSEWHSVMLAKCKSNKPQWWRRGRQQGHWAKKKGPPASSRPRLYPKWLNPLHFLPPFYMTISAVFIAI